MWTLGKQHLQNASYIIQVDNAMLRISSKCRFLDLALQAGLMLSTKSKAQMVLVQKWTVWSWNANEVNV